jgi:hypothetical protein
LEAQSLHAANEAALMVADGCKLGR